MKKTLRAVFGILLVVVGIGYLGNIFEVWHFRMFFPGWWTLLIILPGLVGLLKNGFKPLYLILIAGGAFLLLDCMNILPEKVTKAIVPGCIVALGVAVVFRGQLGAYRLSEDCQSHTAFFWGSVPNYNGRPFPGAFATAIFGGVDLLLTNAKIQDGAVINAITLFGGVDVILPDGINVEISCLPLFGGVTQPQWELVPGAPTVHVRCICIFGGVSVKRDTRKTNANV